MDKRKWWPYVVVGVAAVIVSVAYPIYFNWWDHKSCRDSGGQWNEDAGKCIEPAHTDIPDTRGSASFEDDNQGGESPRE